MKASLCQIRPKCKASTEYSWSENAIQYMKKATEFQDYLVEVSAKKTSNFKIDNFCWQIFSVVQGELRVLLYRKDEELHSFNEMLIEAGHAEEMEENLNSEV